MTLGVLGDPQTSYTGLESLCSGLLGPLGPCVVTHMLAHMFQLLCTWTS